MITNFGIQLQEQHLTWEIPLMTKMKRMGLKPSVKDTFMNGIKLMMESLLCQWKILLNIWTIWLFVDQLTKVGQKSCFRKASLQVMEHARSKIKKDFSTISIYSHTITLCRLRSELTLSLNRTTSVCLEIQTPQNLQFLKKGSK